MIDPNQPVNGFIIKLLKNPKAWLFIIATLFASGNMISIKYLEMIAGLIAAWVAIILFLRR